MEGTADVALLREVVDRAMQARKPVLECGSGLTTLLLALYAGRRGVPVYALEQADNWVARTTIGLRRLGLTGAASVHHSPVMDYGDFLWYRVPDGLPDEFGLVVCDGPPQRPGEPPVRYGLLPVLRASLSGAVILLDDAGRASEQTILEKWRDEFATTAEVADDSGRTYAIVAVPPQDPEPARQRNGLKRSNGDQPSRFQMPRSDGSSDVS